MMVASLLPHTQSSQNRLSLSLDMTKLTSEQRWLATALDVLTAVFLSALLYDPESQVHSTHRHCTKVSAIVPISM
jgi:hypothetical protein